ncbi:MAG TPA: DNRLRE domain-containing protein [Candidatus Sulfotelmatobacter sp.]|nr:DNRLRE domain-containing protein [Candidatus Sulfotelmatobacter sp.]
MKAGYFVQKSSGRRSCEARKSRALQLWLVVFLLLLTSLIAQAQITPSGDAYTNSATPTTNFGAKTLLDVDAASQISYMQFDLGSIPSGSSITQATLKLYVNTVSKTGSFNVDYVNVAWSEATIDWSNQPPLGGTIAASVPVVTADKNQYLLINVTSALQAWLNGSETNNGIALVANGTLNMTFDSKENTGTSHPPELDVVFTPGQGTITGVVTGAGSGLSGGGTSGSLNLSLTNTCGSGQILSWSGSAWVCTTAKGTGTVTSVASGLGLTGGPISTSGTLSIDTTAVPLLSAANIFTVNQSVVNSVSNTDALALITTNPGYRALVAFNQATSGQAVGILASTNDASGYGIWAANNGTGGTGVYSTTSGGYALSGIDSSFGYGVYGQGGAGVVGSGNPGTYGFSATGMGLFGAGQTGILAESYVCCGYGGYFFGYTAPTGSGSGGTAGISSTGGIGDPTGFLTFSGDGIDSYGGNGTLPGVGGTFVGGTSLATNGSGGEGIFAQGGIPSGSGSYGTAGYFNGDIYVTGAITAGTKDFKIDHPLDPANKYLVHASVESSEMMNIYTGNVTTDGQGLATVKLPEWFETLNTDFRYQLTVIGTFAQAIVGSKIANHQFTIRTNAPNVEVSWQVTGVRQDAYAKAHPLVVEEEKDARTQGFYIHPELYGAPEEKQIEWARNPEMMKRIKEQREKPRPVIVPPVLAAQRPAQPLPLALQRAQKKK